jgi:transglutaminase-like putative cysteine protease
MLLAPFVTLRGVFTPLPPGRAAARATVRKMRSLVNAWKVSPAMIDAATSVVFLTPAKQPLYEAAAIFDFVRTHIRYTPDVFGVEVLGTPELTMRRQVGDCDDMATLFATLCECVGIPTRFVIAGYSDPCVFEHVYAQVWIGGEWIDCDVTEDYPMGYAPPDPVCLESET